MENYTSSPHPEDYPTRLKYRGINIYNVVPNRYPYMYDIQPYPTLYTSNARVTPKPFPYTNRPWKESFHYGTPQKYVGLIDDLNLRPAYTFYRSDCFTH